MSINLLLGKKRRKKTNISPFPATHTYIKLTFVSFFSSIFFFEPFPKSVSQSVTTITSRASGRFWQTFKIYLAVFCLFSFSPQGSTKKIHHVRNTAAHTAKMVHLAWSSASGMALIKPRPGTNVLQKRQVSIFGFKVINMILHILSFITKTEISTQKQVQFSMSKYIFSHQSPWPPKMSP